MAGAAVASEFETWSTPEHSVRIEYSGAVMDQIRMAAVDGYLCVPHGGVETGGILFGQRSPDLVRILAWRPIACEYLTGPSFVLSAKDEAALKDALQSWRNDPELAGLEPAGWYHSHTRSEIFLSDADVSLFDRYFPQPWQIALVVRPASFAPTRAGFFFREPDGSVHAQSSYQEFPLTAGRAGGSAAVEAPPLSPKREALPVQFAPETPAPVEPELPLAQVQPEIPPAQIGPETPALPIMDATPKGRWPWYVAGLILILIAASAGMYWRLQPARQGFLLSTTDTGDQLRIVWDRSAPSIRNALRGSLAIEDHGVHTEVKLTAAELRSGSIAYARQSGDVAVRLTVELPGGVTVDEVKRFLSPGERGTTPPPPQPDPANQDLQREAEAMRARLEQQKSELSRLEQMVETMHQPGAAAAAPKTQPAPFKPPQTRPTTPATSNIAPPKIDVVQKAPQTTAVAPLPGPPPAAPLPAVDPAPAPKTEAPPASGRLIWTGRLIKNGRLVIQGDHASNGVLNGELPGVAARANAYPGDLTAEGMTLFTTDPKYTRPQTEAAGAQNGWNRTTYTWDVKRAGAIRIVEQPGPQNGYKLVLESEAAKVSVVVIEWHASQ